MIKYERQCPECNKTLSYSSKNSLNRSIRERSICYSCRAYNRESLKPKPSPHFCPSCGKQMEYTFLTGHSGAKRTNAKCKDCWNKSRPSNPIKSRFFKHVKKTDGCWIWTGYCQKNGYGTIHCGKGSIKRAHRISYEIHCGKIPDGLYVCHKCDNPSCVRPDHLFLGTQLDNIRDCISKGRFK